MQDKAALARFCAPLLCVCLVTLSVAPISLIPRLLLLLCCHCPPLRTSRPPPPLLRCGSWGPCWGHEPKRVGCGAVPGAPSRQDTPNGAVIMADGQDGPWLVWLMAVRMADDKGGTRHCREGYMPGHAPQNGAGSWSTHWPRRGQPCALWRFTPWAVLGTRGWKHASAWPQPQLTFHHSRYRMPRAQVPVISGRGWAIRSGGAEPRSYMDRRASDSRQLQGGAPRWLVLARKRGRWAAVEACAKRAERGSLRGPECTQRQASTSGQGTRSRVVEKRLYLRRGRDPSVGCVAASGPRSLPFGS